jgi:hypothetical protein
MARCELRKLAAMEEEFNRAFSQILHTIKSKQIQGIERNNPGATAARGPDLGQISLKAC